MVLLLVGVVVLAAQAAGVGAGNLLADWWPVLVVALGALQWLADRRPTVGSAVVVGVGLVLLASTTGVFGGGLGRVGWPLVVIGAGLWVIFGRPARRRRSRAGDEVGLVAAFSSRKLAHGPGPLRTGAVSAFFGHGELDLSGSEPVPGGVRLSATVAFAGIDVIVPDGWRVSITGLPIFGGWDNTTRRVAEGSGPEMHVNALVLFGGLEVRHRERWG